MKWPYKQQAFLLSLAGLVLICPACSPTSLIKKGIKFGVHVVGDEVQEAEVEERGKKLIGQPLRAADAEFGPRIESLADTRSPRVVIAYRVKGDLTDRFRWVVEAENDRIVALAKAIRNADVGKDQVKTFVMKEMIEGKTRSEIESKSTFQKLRLVLRRQNTGRIVCVYDVSGLTDVLEARYCLVEFDETDRMSELRLVTVPATTDD